MNIAHCFAYRVALQVCEGKRSEKGRILPVYLQGSSALMLRTDSFAHRHVISLTGDLQKCGLEAAEVGSCCVGMSSPTWPAAQLSLVVLSS